jgi:hypothetical protein
MFDILNPYMERIMELAEDLFGCIPGSIRYRNENEPHLVKYNSVDHQGVCMHTDRCRLPSGNARTHLPC